MLKSKQTLRIKTQALAQEQNTKGWSLSTPIVLKNKEHSIENPTFIQKPQTQETSSYTAARSEPQAVDTSPLPP